LKRLDFELIKTKGWYGYWGKHLKPERFKKFNYFQTMNHFPNSFEVGRKDKMYKNYEKMKQRLARPERQDMNYCPETLILPRERKRLLNIFSTHSLWIIKPPASARGIGIKVISSESDLPRKKSLLVSRYIHQPFLIQGKKFDLRLYVLVTSFDPLIIFLYEEGIVRFAADA
jgi:tubulin polyglutamylase TTLL4